MLADRSSDTWSGEELGEFDVSGRIRSRLRPFRSHYEQGKPEEHSPETDGYRLG